MTPSTSQPRSRVATAAMTAMKTAAAVAAAAAAVRASARAFAAFLSDAPTAAERHRDAEGVDVDDGWSMARASGVMFTRRDAAKGVRASGDSARVVVVVVLVGNDG